MCLILFSLNQHPQYKFILAANRDEFFNRPTKEAGYWRENKNIIGGRDLNSGGTWLGVTKTGRLIAITNYRDLSNENKNARSRGLISKDFLINSQSNNSFLNNIYPVKNEYSGFNLLLSDNSFETITHYSNISDKTEILEEGTHGLSNHLLDTPWPKIQYGKDQLTTLLNQETIHTYDIISILKNNIEAPDKLLPDTGISYELEKKLSPVFISMKGYGTRCSTALIIDYNNNVSFLEISYDDNKEVINEKQFKFWIIS